MNKEVIANILQKLEVGITLTKEEYDKILGLFKPDNVKSFLSAISIEDIESRREYLNRINFNKLNDKELFNVIMEALSFDYSGSRFNFLFPNFSVYKTGTLFYRVRRVSNNDCFFPINTLNKEQDAWNPPADMIKNPGRLNKVGESLLYTSPITPVVALEEMHIISGERFCLIVYEALSDIKVVNIGMLNNSPDFSPDENLKIRMIMNILGDLFSRDVGKGTEYLYKVSERIAKDYFDLPREQQDAWCYPSVALKKSVNVCFRPNVAKSLLKLKGIQIGTCNRLDKGFHLKMPLVAIWDAQMQKFCFHLADSTEGRNVFR